MDSSGIEGKTSFDAILFILFHRVFLLVDHIFYLHPTSSEWREAQKMISPRAFLALAQTITKTSHTTARCPMLGGANGFSFQKNLPLLH
jgi:hypothetical protein